MQGVSFAYGSGPEVLHDVSVRVAPGERLALVGPTGAGKSTLAKLIARFYDPAQGTVAFGGTDLRDATISSLRQRIVVVPQEGYLFAGSIRENVRVGRPEATDAEVDAALEALGSPRAVRVARRRARHRGARTRVTTLGRRAPAGVARAALADPTLLVLDEATSNLDPGTEHTVERALEALTAKRTVVVVAHRLSTAARRPHRRRRRRPHPRDRHARRPAARRRSLREPLGQLVRLPNRDRFLDPRPWCVSEPAIADERWLCRRSSEETQPAESTRDAVQIRTSTGAIPGVGLRSDLKSTGAAKSGENPVLSRNCDAPASTACRRSTRPSQVAWPVGDEQKLSRKEWFVRQASCRRAVAPRPIGGLQ